MKALKSLIFCLIVFLGVSSVAKAAPLSRAPSILYVKQGGKSDCLSWTTACGLQTALTEANIGNQVWVAAGTYKPTTLSSRFATFQLKTGVAIYGGFPADGGDWETRDWVNNLTTLSGDIGTLSVSTDNSYHVVTGSGVTATAVLAGFTISGGNADGIPPHYYGGGMYNSSSSPTLTNVTFSTNSATRGGGMYNDSSSPTLTNVTFTGNSATNFGGGMYSTSSSSPTLTNVTFTGNSATYGGGLYN
jgi:predicted outer membrane repeat protein